MLEEGATLGALLSAVASAALPLAEAAVAVVPLSVVLPCCS
jgi:hypothetical protein